MTGARSAIGGPTGDLLLAYRGTAYFLRALLQLPEREYDAPGHPDAAADRRRTIAAVGYDARGWARLAEGLREGDPDPVAFEPGEREAAIEFGTSLPPRALRHLVEHSATHLRVEWRDLPADRWTGSGEDGSGARVSMIETPWRRAAQTWVAAVDLGTGASFADFPPALVDRLVDQHTRGLQRCA